MRWYSPRPPWAGAKIHPLFPLSRAPPMGGTTVNERPSPCGSLLAVCMDKHRACCCEHESVLPLTGGGIECVWWYARTPVSCDPSETGY